MKIVKKTANPPGHVINLIKELLEKAEAGEIDSLAYARVTPNGEVHTASGWENHGWILIGAVSRLHWELHNPEDE